MKDVNLLISNGVNVQGSLELFGDMDTYNETLEDFLDAVEEKMSQIKAYKEVSDMANYAILVHSLKSDARYLGFTTLAELSYNHEMESKANNVGYVYDHYDELVLEAEKIIKLVKTYLGKPVNKENFEPKRITISDKTILIVDDSNIIRNLVQKIFDDDYGILTANDGKEAIDLISTSSNNIVGMLLDLNMPNVNGFEVLEYFKNNNLFSKIPVSIITGDDSKDTIQRAFNYPITDVLAKPFNERDVKRVVTAMINFK